MPLPLLIPALVAAAPALIAATLSAVEIAAIVVASAAGGAGLTYIGFKGYQWYQNKARRESVARQAELLIGRASAIHLNAKKMDEQHHDLTIEMQSMAARNDRHATVYADALKETGELLASIREHSVLIEGFSGEAKTYLASTDLKDDALKQELQEAIKQNGVLIAKLHDIQIKLTDSSRLISELQQSDAEAKLRIEGLVVENGRLNTVVKQQEGTIVNCTRAIEERDEVLKQQEEELSEFESSCSFFESQLGFFSRSVSQNSLFDSDFDSDSDSDFDLGYAPKRA